MSITYSVCVFVALAIQHATCMRHIVICGMPRSTIFFPTFSHKRQDFRKKNYWKQNVCFDFLYNLDLTHFSFWQQTSEIWSKMYIGLHVKYPFFSSNFNETWIFWTDFRKILKYQIFMRIRLVGAELFHADGQTDTKKLIVDFCNFAKRV